jgi:hypothetical protein
MGFKLTTLVMIGTDCTGSCKSNYNMITTMKAPQSDWETLKKNLSVFVSSACLKILPMGTEYEMLKNCYNFVSLCLKKKNFIE